MENSQFLKPRDVVKLAFQFQETDYVPYSFPRSLEQEEALTACYGGERWQDRLTTYIGRLTGFDCFLTLEEMIPQPDGSMRDCLGCSWLMGTTSYTTVTTRSVRSRSVCRLHTA